MMPKCPNSPTAIAIVALAILVLILPNTLFFIYSLVQVVLSSTLDLILTPPPSPTTQLAPPPPPPPPAPLLQPPTTVTIMAANPATATTSWFQKQITLPARARGSYLVTDHIVSELPELRDYKVGLLNLFVQHTSCALGLNENWDEDVRADMSDALDRIAPEEGPNGEDLYRHSAEGSDDMPAHIKSALIGASVMIPIRDGKLCTGTWQGIWHLEFRASKHQRSVVATIQGERTG